MDVGYLTQGQNDLNNNLLLRNDFMDCSSVLQLYNQLTGIEFKHEFTNYTKDIGVIHVNHMVPSKE
jgi:hypothetical protein